jgi:hypothetical protein
MTKTKISVGRYYRLTTSARIDCIGRVTAVRSDGFIDLRIPNWTADGRPTNTSCRPEALEPSTALACRSAAAAR